MVSSGELMLCFDARILSEYHDVLRRSKFRLEHDKVAALMDYIEYRGQIVAASPLPHSLPDPEDEPFLEIALSGDAEYLITGNHAHYPPNLCKGARVLSPASFLNNYSKQLKPKKSRT
jgi:predicted nucleic acid-binding protein